ncbi:hypothetical protein D7147_06505 [Micromonospora musae]|uniref:Uncharacterized protein n=1 Tax=Micromonospora musae TaxID=1894970 RepID=A0A3A9Y9Y9_9ACTN|nr:hypothetical protein D7147_06505 [Micromonospora musae]RKN34089.1 hypothetical protein D7044_10455 [Micromonospora musae]
MCGQWLILARPGADRSDLLGTDALNSPTVDRGGRTGIAVVRRVERAVGEPGAVIVFAILTSMADVLRI